jgi:hypothetical protein
VVLRNNILVGQTDFLQPFENTCLVYQETFAADPFDMDHSIIVNVKHDLCLGARSRCGIAPGLVDTSIGHFDARLAPGSPAIDAGTAAGAPADDFDRRRRDSRPDIGAHEFAAFGPAQFNCLFDWAERTYPELFSPPGAASNWSEPYDYRYYPQTHAYLARSVADEHVYYLGPLSGHTILDVGEMAAWLVTAGCR